MRTPAHGRRRPRGDDGDIVFGALVRMTLTLSILGVMVWDGAALATGHFQAEDHAQAAAAAAVVAYAPEKNIQTAYDAAFAEVVTSGDTIDVATFVASPDGSITLRLERSATTLAVHRIPGLREYAVVARTVTARAKS